MDRIFLVETRLERCSGERDDRLAEEIVGVGHDVGRSP
jgi:hypothetical protein